MLPEAESSPFPAEYHTTAHTPGLQEGPPRLLSAPTPSSVSGPVHPMETACYCAEISRTQRQWVQTAQGSILIPVAFTLFWQLVPPEQNPEPAKNSTKATPRSFACRGEATPPSRPFTQAECALGLEPKGLSASTTTFLEPQGNNNKLCQSEQGGASSPPPRLTLCQLPSNLPGCSISLER